MNEPLVPAALHFTADGTPFSERFDDVYHSAAGGLGQARHVFLGGNALPGRWAGRERFVILETGFGLGLNFLATWQAWRDDPRRPARLHFVSVEAHPLKRADLAAAHARHSGIEPLARELQARWPLLVPGVHRLAFDDERVILTLAFADIRSALPQLRLAADAIYLDGFSPAKNPGMWSREALRPLVRLAAPGATAATWSAAAGVRESLEAAGFAVEKREGFAHKRDMLVGRRGAAARDAVARGADRRAVIVGAGVAGAAVAERLCARGWSVTLLERHAAPAMEASGNPAASFHPILTADDSLLARLTRASLLATLARWTALEAQGHPLRWSRCGALQIARSAREEAAMRAALEALAPPADYAALVTREEASRHAGAEVAAGGLWFPSSGWVQPPALVRALLAACGTRLEARYGIEVAAIERDAGGWSLRDVDGREQAHSDVVILANAADGARLAPSRFLSLRRVRGQLSFLPAQGWRTPGAVVLRGGFALPAIDGRVQIGASYDLEDDDPEPRDDSHAGNLERLERVLPEAGRFDPGALSGRVAFRAVAPDRLPLVGAMPNETAHPAAATASLPSLVREPGLYSAFGYASRGVLWSALMAEQLASIIEREPLPLEGSLSDAIDPGRFMVRALRRGR